MAKKPTGKRKAGGDRRVKHPLKRLKDADESKRVPPAKANQQNKETVGPAKTPRSESKRTRAVDPAVSGKRAAGNLSGKASAHGKKVAATRRPAKPKKKPPPRTSPLAGIKFKSNAKPISDDQLPDAVAKFEAIGTPLGDAYAAKKARERERQAQQSRDGKDIGAIPQPANPERRAAAVASLIVFAETYFAERFPLAWSDDHREQWESIERVIREGGLQAIAAPRGDGKTTRLEVAVMWAVLCGHHQYAVLLTATMKHAPRRITSVKAALMANEMLAEDFPEACTPIRAMGGIANRCAGMTTQSEPCWPACNESQWSSKRVILPSTPGSCCGGGIIESSGLLEATRGLNYARADGTIARPTLALIDDPQTDRTARSPLQTQAREEVMAQGILFLPGPSKQLSGLASLTVIRPGDLADRMLDRSSHPEWHGIRKKFCYAMPTNTKWWDAYADLYREELSRGQTDHPETTRLYLAEREIADAGALVAWEERHPGASSAIEYFMRAWVRDRRSAAAELQNEPESDQDLSQAVMLPTAEALSTRQSTYGRSVIPLTATRLTFFVDVQKELLYWAVCAWSEGVTGVITDYATWPKQDAVYFDHSRPRHTITNDKRITATTREGQTLQALDILFGELAGRTWKREDGVEVHSELGMVDAQDGNVTDQVYEACRAAKKKYGLTVRPSHGEPFGPAKCPISRYEQSKNKGAKLGEDWIQTDRGTSAKRRVIQHVRYDSGRRKSYLWRRLLTPPGDPGSLQLYAAEPSRHRLICEHLVSERGTQVYGPYGELTVWTLTPGQPNHWLDCVSGCVTAELILGGKLRPSVAAATRPAAVPGAGGNPTATAAKPKPRGGGSVKYFNL